MTRPIDDRGQGPRARNGRRRPTVIALVAAAVVAASPAAAQRAAPAEAPPAELLAAVDWYTGVADSVDDARARILLERAAATGHPLARMWIARCLSRGRMGFPRDPVRAAALADSVVADVRTLAEGGVLEAVFLMGTAHDEALGVAEDAGAAADWYRRAAEVGHVLAQHNLGNAYRTGRGVPADDALAVRWWRPAAEAGDAIAQLRMGEMSQAGTGTPVDLDAARVWYGRAAARGNAAALQALARLSRPGG